MTPTWSVLLPTHDRADVVGFAISSVLAQTDPDLELLVVGDGCTDDTSSVVTAFDDPRVRWFDLPKAAGFGYANRNLALHEARGTRIAFMAHDDLMLPDHLERMGAALERPGTEWAYSRPLWVDDDGTKIPLAVDLRRPQEFSDFMEARNVIPATCVVHRRECLERYGYWPEESSSGGDLVLWRRMVGPSAGANLGYVPTPTCLHFRADWRTGAEWGPRELMKWRAAADAGWWPTPLRAGSGVNGLPQEIAWASIMSAPVGYTEELRQAVTDVIDGLAWGSVLLEDQLADERTRARSLEHQLAEATRVAKEASRMQASMALTIDELMGSTSWHDDRATPTGRSRGAGNASAPSVARASAARSRVELTPLGGAIEKIVEQRVKPRRSCVGIPFEVGHRVEVRARIMTFVHAVECVVGEWVQA